MKGNLIKSIVAVGVIGAFSANAAIAEERDEIRAYTRGAGTGQGTRNPETFDASINVNPVIRGSIDATGTGLAAWINVRGRTAPTGGNLPSLATGPKVNVDGIVGGQTDDAPAAFKSYDPTSRFSENKLATRDEVGATWEDIGSYYGYVNGVNVSPATGRNTGLKRKDGRPASWATNKGNACNAIWDACQGAAGGVMPNRSGREGKDLLPAFLNREVVMVDNCDEADAPYWTCSSAPSVDCTTSGAADNSKCGSGQGTCSDKHVNCTWWCTGDGAKGGKNGERGRNPHCSLFSNGNCVQSCRETQSFCSDPTNNDVEGLLNCI